MAILEKGSCMVFVTAGSEAEAKSIARALVQEKLAACVSLFPVSSIYMWQNALQEEGEWQLVIKTQAQRFNALAERVRSLHSYKVPELIALPIQAGSADYLQWINATMQSGFESE